MKSLGLVKHCLQVWPQDGVGPGVEAADDREPSEGAQDGHPLGSHKTNDTILDLLVLFFGIFL